MNTDQDHTEIVRGLSNTPDLRTPAGLRLQTELARVGRTWDRLQKCRRWKEEFRRRPTIAGVGAALEEPPPPIWQKAAFVQQFMVQNNREEVGGNGRAGWKIRGGVLELALHDALYRTRVDSGNGHDNDDTDRKR